MGVDANATRPADFKNITGALLATAAKSHTAAMAASVTSWFGALGVRAMNTFGDVSNISSLASLWTCGTKRRLASRTQIDFVAVSCRVQGQAQKTAWGNIQRLRSPASGWVPQDAQHCYHRRSARFAITGLAA